MTKATQTMTLSEFPDVGRVEEVAAVLRCSKWCVYDMINIGAAEVDPARPRHSGDSPGPRGVPVGVIRASRQRLPASARRAIWAAAWSRAGMTWL